MGFRKARIWSPSDLEYLEKHYSDPVNQLTIALQHSRSAIKNKLAELDGKTPSPKKKRLRSKIGKRKDLDGLFLRSGWEANVLRLLRLDKTIAKIEYEPMDFTFWQFGIHKGTVSYTPDFKVIYQDGSYIWIEIKGGLLKPTDKTKIRRFQKYYPNEFSHLVAVTPGPKSKTAQFFQEMSIPIKYYYPDLNKEYKNKIPNWE